MVIRVKFFQTDLINEICSDSLVRAIGKVLLIKHKRIKVIMKNGLCL